MRRHLETLQHGCDTHCFLGAQSVSCVFYVRFCTNLCAIPICSALPGPLHPSRRYFQPAFGLLPKRPGQFPLEGLHPWQQAAHHDPQRRRIPAALPFTRVAQGLRPHPFLRLPRQPPTLHSPAHLPTTTRGSTASAFAMSGFAAATLHVVLSRLRWTHDDH